MIEGKRVVAGEAILNEAAIVQLKIEASTTATPGKPLIVGSVDDPNSKRQFQLELTVTRLK
jgi:hypothetical protein